MRDKKDIKDVKDVKDIKESGGVRKRRVLWLSAALPLILAVFWISRYRVTDKSVNQTDAYMPQGGQAGEAGGAEGNAASVTRGGGSGRVAASQERYEREMSVDLPDKREYVLRISSVTDPGTGEYRIERISLCRLLKDGGEEVVQTILPGDAKVLYTRAMGGAEESGDDGGDQWCFSSQGDTLFAKPLYSLEDLPGQAAAAFLEGDSGEMWSYAPDGGILVADLNFDGYDDICLQAGVGSVNTPYFCYLWSEGRFEYTYMIPNIQVNGEEGLLESVTKDGDGVYSIKYYRFDEHNRLHLVRYVEENQSPDAVFPLLDLRYCEDGYYTLPAVDEWDYGTAHGGALAERLVYWARQALTELYEWSGTKIETAYFSASEFGGFFFGNSRADMKADRIFFDRTYGARAGFEHCIESMRIVTGQMEWYSGVTQWNVPEDLDHMTDAQVVEWYFGRASVSAGEKAVSVTQSYGNAFVVRAESGNYYELTLEPTTRQVDTVYGPYDGYPVH